MHPLVDTNITNKSTVERGFAANRYASRKNDNANAIIDNGNLPYHFSAITFGTFGSFETGTWWLINTACDEASHPTPSTTTTLGACLAPSEASFSPSASPCNGRTRTCCGVPTSAGGKLYLATNIPLAPALAT